MQIHSMNSNLKFNWKQKILFPILVFIIIVFFRTISDRHDIIYKKLVEIEEKSNKDLPMIINSDLRFDSTKALKWNKYAYYYTFYINSIEDFDIENFENNIKPSLIDNAKENSEMNVVFKDFKITMVFIFKDKDGIDIKNIEIPYKEYK